MPPRAKWRRDGTSESEKPIDIRLDGLGRLQIPSGTLHRSAYLTRVNAIREAWALGGVWSEAVRGLKARRFTIDRFMQERAQGIAGIEALLKETGELLSDVIRDYLKSTKAGDKPKMKQRLERFASWLGKRPLISDVTTARVDAFLTGLTDLRTENTPAQGSTVNRYRAVIGGLCTYAVNQKRLAEHPIAGRKVEKRDEPEHRLPEMSSDEYREYFGAVRGDRPDLGLVLLLLVHSAPDVGEVWSRVVADVDLDGARIRYRRTKTKRHKTANKPRWVPLPSLLVTELRAHIEEHGLTGSAELFSMFSRRDLENLHARARRKITRDELTLKDFRHIAAIAWVKSGVHIRLVQRWLGHASLSQTMKYTDYEPDEGVAVEMAERAAETLHRAKDSLAYSYGPTVAVELESPKSLMPGARLELARPEGRGILSPQGFADGPPQPTSAVALKCVTFHQPATVHDNRRTSIPWSIPSTLRVSRPARTGERVC